MRVLLYTGKGGVGKTTTAAATALRAAELGHRTIVLSTDAAHSLADSLDLRLGPTPTAIAQNLWGMEVDIYHEVEAHWGSIQKYLSTLFAWRGLDSVVAEELTVPPGMYELASLIEIVRLHESKQYDLIVVDAAPTGETLELLAFPEIARWWMEKIFPVQRRVAQVARPIVRTVVGMPLPGDDVFDAVAGLFRELDKMRSILADPELTSIRLVVNPEKMVLKEAERTYTYLNLYGYPVDLVVCNRVIPEEVTDAYFETWKASQARYIQMVESSFYPIPIKYVPLMESEIVGHESLTQVAGVLFPGEDPTAVFYHGKGYSFEKKGRGYELVMPLPLTTRSEVNLQQVGDELVIQVGSQKRNLILPRALVGMQTHGARLDGDVLRVEFEPPPGARSARQ
ncbi:MAG TPA: TRC40/GET3/ArsA family transport-energizing ATPase [Chloroflexota bacterium]